MADISEPVQTQEADHWEDKFRAYLVGFPDTSLVQILPKLVPEARFIPQEIFRHDRAPGNLALEGSLDLERTGNNISDHTQIDTNVANGDFFSPAWIVREAYYLLDRIQRETGNAGHRKILLGGHGFGGIVIKQAIVIANTNPKYYRIASKIGSLIFLNTPNQAPDPQTWEKLIVELIPITSKPYSSNIISSFTTFVSHLSHVFCVFHGKYIIRNIVPKNTIGAVLAKFSNGPREAAIWPDDKDRQVAICSIDEFPKLKILRCHFAPAYLLCNQNEQGIFDPKKDAAYFETLQALSDSQWIIYQSKTVIGFDDYNILKNTYRSVLERVPFGKKGGGVIRVTGGNGQSKVMRLISHHIRQKSSAIIIDNFLSPLENYPPTLYGVIISCIHQIISQQPSLFRHIRDLTDEMFHQHVWTAESVKNALHVLLLQSSGVDFLVVIYEYESHHWPSEVRELWTEISGLIETVVDATFTFIVDSTSYINGLATQTQLTLDVEKDIEQHRNPFEQIRLTEVLATDYPSISLRGKLCDATEEQMMTLSTPRAVNGTIQGGQTIAGQLCCHRVDQVIEGIAGSKILCAWSIRVTSWVRLAIRPLRIEELATASAIDTNNHSISDMIGASSMDIEEYLRRHVGGLVAVENGYVRVADSIARDTLFGKHMLDDDALAILCLHYLKTILRGDDTDLWGKCLSHISFKHQMHENRAPVMEFLDYATRYWPTHVLRAEKVSSELRSKIVDFFNTPIVAERWFQLFLNCHGLSPTIMSDCLDIPQEDILRQRVGLDVSTLSSFEATTEDVMNTEGNTQTDGSGDNNHPEVTIANFDGGPMKEAKKSFSVSDHLEGIVVISVLQQSSAAMVGFVGLSPRILGIPINEDSVHSVDSKVLYMRHGSMEYKPVFLNSGSRYYLECAIWNDASVAVAKLLETDLDRVIKYFPLHMAAAAGSTETTRMLLKRLGGTIQGNNEGRTPLHMAAINGNTAVIQIIADVMNPEKGTGFIEMITVQDKNHETPLIIATRLGHPKAAKLLAGFSESSFTITDKTGKTPAHHAAASCPQVLEYFLSKVPEVLLASDHYGSTPLDIAARVGCEQALCIILSAAENRNNWVADNDKLKKSPLHSPAEGGFIGVIKLLLARYMDHGPKWEIEWKAVAELAVKRGYLEILKMLDRLIKPIQGQLLVTAAEAGHPSVVEYFLQNKTDPNGETDAPHRPLGLAASGGIGTIVHLLLQHGADINLQDSEGRTPLHLAAMHGRRSVMEMLLKHLETKDGKLALLHGLDNRRYTALHYAASTGNAEITELILKSSDRAGRWFFPRLDRFPSPLHLAVASPDTVRLLLKAPIYKILYDDNHQTPLHKAIEIRQLETIHLLLENGADIDKSDKEGKSPLCYAIEMDDISLAEKLLENRPLHSVDYVLKDLERAMPRIRGRRCPDNMLKFLLSKFQTLLWATNYGHTLLHTAVRHRAIKVIDFLFRSGADLNAVSRFGDTPLHDAATSGDEETISALLRLQPDINKTNNADRTPLHLAAYEGNSRACHLLLNADASITVLDENNFTPLHTASAFGRLDAVKTLLGYGINSNSRERSSKFSLDGTNNLGTPQSLVVNEPKFSTKDDPSPLNLAVVENHPAVVEVLLKDKSGADIGERHLAVSFYVALNSAFLDVTRVFLAHREKEELDFSKKWNLGQSPMHLAVRNGAEYVKMLLKKESDFQDRTYTDLTCLDIAVESHDCNSLAVLLGIEGSGIRALDWADADLIKAYWTAVRHKELGCLKLLVKKESELLRDRTPSHWHNALEDELFCNLGSYDEHFSVELVRLGIDPWERRPYSKKSAFELGIMSGCKLNMRFLTACLDKLRDTLREKLQGKSSAAGCGLYELLTAAELDTLAPELGFHELRIATELDVPAAWDILKFLREKAGNSTDEDGWNIDHFLYQSQPRFAFSSWDESAIECKTPKPTGFIQTYGLPVTEWIDLIIPEAPSNDTEVELPALDRVEKDFPISLRADHPFPPREKGLSYYEVTLKLDKRDSLIPTINIGFCGEFSRLLCGNHGRDVWTTSYYGTGKMFANDGESVIESLEKSYWLGDTVGCGIDYENGRFFFTLNGVVVTKFASKVIYRKLYPCICRTKEPAKLTLNFGESDFKWALGNQLSSLYAKCMDMEDRRRSGEALESTASSPGGYIAPWETLPETPTLPCSTFQGTADINGISLWYATFGNSYKEVLERGISPVVFLHGGGIHSNWWGHQIQYLKEKHYSVIAIDSRGHGRSSDDHSIPLSYAQMARDVIALMDLLEIPRFSVVGWSDGAIIGLEIAMNYASRLDRFFSYGATYQVSNFNETGASQSPALALLGPRVEQEYKALSPTPDQYDVFIQRKNEMQATQPHWTAEAFQKIPTLYAQRSAPMIWIVDGDSEELVKRNVPGEIRSFDVSSVPDDDLGIQ
ncbi:hypothetical protein FQN50_002151 [Emmonsiellopsis sp. PD_5]|nr:hypothetical protein FQN50_002151 [Emmonsiellopsis sp. PD_5]